MTMLRDAFIERPRVALALTLVCLLALVGAAFLGAAVSDGEKAPPSPNPALRTEIRALSVELSDMREKAARVGSEKEGAEKAGLRWRKRALRAERRLSRATRALNRERSLVRILRRALRRERQ